VFFTSAPGLVTANGPTHTTTTARASARNRNAARLPSLTTSRATATASAGHAVAFIEEAMPSATPADSSLPGRHRNAKPRHMKATIGTSVPPTASSNAMTGEAVIKMAQRRQSFAPPTDKATANTAKNTRPNQILGSVNALWPKMACGTPNAAISGR